jgi:hypothetical protein
MVRFRADASLHHAIVTGCARREPVIDFLSAQSAKLDRMSDPGVPGIAASQGRNLVTHDFRTMPKHFAEFLAAGGSSPGVFLVTQQTPPGLGHRGSCAGLDGVNARRLDESNCRDPAALSRARER